MNIDKTLLAAAVAALLMMVTVPSCHRKTETPVLEVMIPFIRSGSVLIRSPWRKVRLRTGRFSRL